MDANAHNHAYHYALKRLKQIGLPSRIAHIKVIRELIEDHGLPIRAAVRGTGIVFGIGMLEEIKLIEEATKRYECTQTDHCRYDDGAGGGDHSRLRGTGRAEQEAGPRDGRNAESDRPLDHRGDGGLEP